MEPRQEMGRHVGSVKGKPQQYVALEPWQERGTWVAHSVKCPTLGFCSGHGLTVYEIKPCIELCVDSAEPAWDSLFLSASLSLSLKINK